MTTTQAKSLVWLSLLGCILALATAGCGGGDDDGDDTGKAGTGTSGGSGNQSGSGGKTETAGTSGGGGKGSTAGASGGGSGSGGGGKAGSGNDASVPTGDCSMSGPALADGECKEKAEGIYAFRSTLDVYWEDEKNADAPIIDPGRGQMIIYLMGDLKDVCDDGKGTGVMKACGAVLPAFTADITCDSYQLEFEDAIWDRPEMPTFLTPGMADGFTPGSTLTLALATGLVGLKLDGNFPTSTETGTFACEGGKKMGFDCFPDHDTDGFPGVTLHLKTGGTFTPPNCGEAADQPPCQCGAGMGYTYRGSPTTLALDAGGGSGGGVRAVEVHVGLRTRLGGSGLIDPGCMSGKGDGEAPKDAIQSRVQSCKVDPTSVPDGEAHVDNDCSPEEATFVDDNVPNFHVLQKGDKPPTMANYPLGLAAMGKMINQTPSVGPLSSVVRLGNRGEKFTCVDVRAAKYP